jgi:hypothetical protein
MGSLGSVPIQDFVNPQLGKFNYRKATKWSGKSQYFGVSPRFIFLLTTY